MGDIKEKSGEEQSLIVCDECGSEYYQNTSIMMKLCPECSNILYGYDNCNHEFEKGRCLKCFWNGNTSQYTINKEN
ncbi:MAG: hypothetical protein FWG90_11240 [Oscillospiraceae bacterium]|nr:hypothetical protein [Oscillospiraceae bacterium]